MIPHEKEMVERLKDRPFALLGINSDGDRESLNKLLAENGITCKQAVDGTTEGPIATRWNVQGWPTIYILDHEGKIRARDLRDEAMEKKVVELLDEMKAR